MLQCFPGVEQDFYFNYKHCSLLQFGYDAYVNSKICVVCLCPHSWPSTPLISCPPTGLEDYMKRYGEGITRVLNSFGPVPDFFSEGAKSIINVSMMAAKVSHCHCNGGRGLTTIRSFCPDLICDFFLPFQTSEANISGFFSSAWLKVKSSFSSCLHKQ